MFLPFDLLLHFIKSQSPYIYNRNRSRFYPLFSAGRIIFKINYTPQYVL